MTNYTDINPSQITSKYATCPAVGYQKTNICVPVTVSPFAKIGTTKTTCCGKAKVSAGSTVCKGTKNGVCNFTISQTIWVEVPVDFGAYASVGDTFVDCIDASADNICTNCKPTDNL